MKKEYEIPATTVVKVRTEMLLADTNEVHAIGGGTFNYGGKGKANDVARGRGGNDWSDE